MPTKQEISDLQERVKSLAESARKQIDYCTDEQKTIQYLINPFIQSILGYNTDKHEEAEPQFIADPKGQGGKKVDYALKHMGQAIMLVEAKKYGDSLEKHICQLRKYLAALAAPVGILTDGVLYLFFHRVGDDYVDDLEPFFVFNLLRYTDEDVEPISHFTKKRLKDDYSRAVESLRDSILELRVTRDIRRRIVSEISKPSRDLAKLLAAKVNAYQGSFAGKKVERFKSITAKAFKQVLAEEAQKAVAAAEANRAEQRPRSSETHSTQDDAVVEPSQQTVTVNPDPEVPAPSGKNRRYDLLAMGIPVRARLDYHKGGHHAFVTGSNTVEFQGKEMRLIDATKPLVGEDNIRPIAHWLYKGRPLQKCYDEWVERG